MEEQFISNYSLTPLLQRHRQNVSSLKQERNGEQEDWSVLWAEYMDEDCSGPRMKQTDVEEHCG